MRNVRNSLDKLISRFFYYLLKNKTRCVSEHGGSKCCKMNCNMDDSAEHLVPHRPLSEQHVSFSSGSLLSHNVSRHHPKPSHFFKMTIKQQRPETQHALNHSRFDKLQQPREFFFFFFLN